MSELLISRTFPAGLEALFGAFADPFLLRRWYGGPPGAYRTGATGDVAPGERFHLLLMDASGAEFAQVGRILSFEPGVSLALEMGWQGGPMAGVTSRAALAFSAVPAGSELTVRQGPFPSEAACDWHARYWQACLDRLARVLAGEPVVCLEEFWAESRGYHDPLGLAAYAVLAGLREAGAAPEAIAGIEDALYTHLSALDEETAGALGTLLRTRLAAP